MNTIDHNVFVLLACHGHDHGQVLLTFGTCMFGIPLPQLSPRDFTLKKRLLQAGIIPMEKHE